MVTWWWGGFTPPPGKKKLVFCIILVSSFWTSFLHFWIILDSLTNHPSKISHGFCYPKPSASTTSLIFVRFVYFHMLFGMGEAGRPPSRTGHNNIKLCSKVFCQLHASQLPYNFAECLCPRLWPTTARHIPCLKPHFALMFA